MGKDEKQRDAEGGTANPVARSVMRTNAVNHDEGADPVTTKTPADASPASTSSEADSQPTGPAPARTSARRPTSATTSETAASAPSAAEPSTPATGERPASVPPASSSRDSGAQFLGPSTSGAGKPGSIRPANGPRRVRLGVTRIDPWSVLKFSFLMSFAIGIIIVVGAAMLWYLLNGLHVFTTINDTLAEIAGDETQLNILDAVTFSRTVSLATIVALVDIVLLTALSTIFAFLYNITASLVGGVTVTLSDE